MEIRIQSPQSSYITGEAIQVEVDVRNTGGEPVTLPLLSDPHAPQPYFVLRGPSFAKPYRLHWSGNPPKPGQAPSDVSRVAPGQSLKETLTLPASLAFPMPGAHELYATYEWNGAVVESNRISVRIEALGPPVFRIVGRTPLSSRVAIQALSVNGPTIYLATFHEERPDLGETSFGGLARLASIDPGATDFFAPWCETAQAGFIGPRFGWRTGNALTVAGYRKLPQRIELPFTPRVHGPSLMGANGDIDLLVTDAPGTHLALVRFPNVGYDQPPPPARVIWTSGAPEPITDLTATLNPGGARHAVLRQGSSVRLATWDDTGPRLDPQIPISGRPVPTVAPAIHVSTSGVVRASVVTADVTNPRKFSLTEVTSKTGAPLQTTTTPPFELEAGIRTGTIAYSMSAVEAPRREWFFVLESRRVQSSRSEGKARVTKRDVVEPPQLLVMREVTYALEVRRRPELNAID